MVFRCCPSVFGRVLSGPAVIPRLVPVSLLSVTYYPLFYLLQRKPLLYQFRKTGIVAGINPFPFFGTRGFLKRFPGASGVQIPLVSGKLFFLWGLKWPGLAKGGSRIIWKTHWFSSPIWGSIEGGPARKILGKFGASPPEKRGFFTPGRDVFWESPPLLFPREIIWAPSSSHIFWVGPRKIKIFAGIPRQRFTPLKHDGFKEEGYLIPPLRGGENAVKEQPPPINKSAVVEEEKPPKTLPGEDFPQY